LTTGAR